MVKERCGAARASGTLYREKTNYEIGTYIAVLPDYKGFDRIFTTNTRRFLVTCDITRRDGA